MWKSNERKKWNTKPKLESLQYLFFTYLFIVSSTMIKNIFLRFENVFFHFFLHTKHKVYQTFLVLSALCLIFNVILFFSHFIRTMCALTHTLTHTFSIFVWNFQTENFTCSLFSTEFCAKFLTFNREKKSFLHSMSCNVKSNLSMNTINALWRQKEKDQNNFQILKRERKKNEVVKHNCEMDNP